MRCGWSIVVVVVVTSDALSNIFLFEQHNVFNG